MPLPRYMQPRYLAFYILASYFARFVATAFMAPFSPTDWARIGVDALGGALHLATFLILVQLAYRPEAVPWSSFVRPQEHPTFSLVELFTLLLASVVVAYGALFASNFGPLYFFGHLPSKVTLEQEVVGMPFLEILGMFRAREAIVLSCLIAPIVEETLFRGFLLNALMRRYSVLRSIVISSIVFGLFHPRDILGSGLTEVLFGLAYVTSGSLLLPIALHALHNLSSIILYYFLGIGRVKDFASVRELSQWYVELAAFTLTVPVLLLVWKMAMNRLARNRIGSTKSTSNGA